MTPTFQLEYIWSASLLGLATVQPPQGVFQVPTERGKGLNSPGNMGSEGPRHLMVARRFI